MRKLTLSIIMSLGVYFLLTLPHFIVLLTMDIDTGNYYGYVYPLWLLIVIGLISGTLGNLIVKHLEK